MCGAPIVMSRAARTRRRREKRQLPRQVQFVVAGAPPPEAVLAAMQRRRLRASARLWPDRVLRPRRRQRMARRLERAARRRSRPALMARQGVRYLALEGLDVMDPDTMQPVPADGATMGEVMMRGNVVMKGYLKDADATGGRLRRRLVPHRRPRGEVPRRLHPAEGPLQGHHHLRRREHLLHRGGGRALQAPRRGGRRRGGAGPTRNGARCPAPSSS